MKKHRAGHTDKTGGLPHNRRTRAIQDYSLKSQTKMKKNKTNSNRNH